eukprot:scpid49209/ scgid27828/ 
MLRRGNACSVDTQDDIVWSKAGSSSTTTSLWLYSYRYTTAILESLLLYMYFFSFYFSAFTASSGVAVLAVQVCVTVRRARAVVGMITVWVRRQCADLRFRMSRSVQLRAHRSPPRPGDWYGVGIDRSIARIY